MAATSQTKSINALLTTTSENWYKAKLPQDNIFQSNPLFHCLHGKEDGIKHEEAGGDLFKINLMYGANTTVKSYEGFDVLDDTPQDGMTSGYAKWADYNGTTTLAGTHKFQNSSKSKIVDLWESKVKQTMGSFSEKMNEDMLDIENVTLSSGATGNGGKNIISLPMMIQAAPGTAGNFHSIAQGDEAWWRNKISDSSATTFKGLYHEMYALYQDCSKGQGGAPDIILSDQKSYADYIFYMDEKIRYEYTETASAGFENVKFLGAKMFWDVNVPNVVVGSEQNGGEGVTLTDGAMYFINSKFMNLMVGKGLDFSPQGVRDAERQNAIREYMYFCGQLITNNRRKHGVLFDLSQGKTA